MRHHPSQFVTTFHYLSPFFTMRHYLSPPVDLTWHHQLMAMFAVMLEGISKQKAQEIHGRWC